MTPYEYIMVLNAFNKRTKQEQEDRITAAYLTAFWYRVKEMPSLKEILGKDNEPEEQTAVDMFEEIKRINAAFGGTTID